MPAEPGSRQEREISLGWPRAHRKGEPLEPHRDLDDRRRVFRLSCIPGRTAAARWTKSATASLPSEALQIRAGDRVGQGQGWNRELLLPRDAQRNATRCQDRQPWSGIQEATDDGGRLGHLFQVVKDPAEGGGRGDARPSESSSARPGCSRTVSTPAIAPGTRLASVIGLRSAKYTPSAKWPSCSSCRDCSRANRVLPMPPGPVSVSRWRLRKEGGGCHRAHARDRRRSPPRTTGRLVRRAPAVRIGGNSSGRPSISSS